MESIGSRCWPSLFGEFAANSPSNSLQQSEQMAFVELLDDIVEDLQIGREAAVDDVVMEKAREKVRELAGAR